MSNGKKLYRVREGRIIAGVCGGLAEYFSIDPVWVRLAAAILAPFTSGAVIVAYLLGWLLIPEKGSNAIGLDDLVDRYTKYRQSHRSGETGYGPTEQRFEPPSDQPD